MKKLVLLYIEVLLLALSIGVAIGLIVYWTWLCVFLFSFIISFGWIPIAGFNKRSPNNPDGAAILLGFAFLILLFMLGYGAVEVDPKNFWGLVYSVSLVSAALLTLVLMIRVRAAFRERTEKEELRTGFKLRKWSIGFYSDASLNI